MPQILRHFYICYSTWQEFVDNYRTFVEEIECDVKRVRELLNDAEDISDDKQMLSAQR